MPFPAGMSRLGWVEANPSLVVSGFRSQKYMVKPHSKSSQLGRNQHATLLDFSFFVSLHRESQQGRPPQQFPAPGPCLAQLKDGWFPCISQETCLPWGILLSYFPPVSEAPNVLSLPQAFQGMLQYIWDFCNRNVAYIT